VRYFKGNKEQDWNPRMALYEDLFHEAMKWKDEGDHIIIAGNMKEDVQKGLTNKFCTVILERHYKKAPPATNGNHTIFRQRKLLGVPPTLEETKSQ
jgi:hypothetical protein